MRDPSSVAPAFAPGAAGTLARPAPLAGMVSGLYDAAALLIEPADELEGALLEDLQAGRLRIVYQPIVALPSRRLIGFEALARLWDAQGRLRPADAFIPLAERSGLVRLLGLEVLARACADLAHWRSLPQGTNLSVTVNVAPRQLEAGFPVAVRDVLRATGLPAAALVLELTESDLLAGDGAAAAVTVQHLSDLGVRLALDDFGTGSSTLENLARLPVQILKLDKGFVSGLDGARAADAAIVRAVLNLANSMGIMVVAEGVETELQASRLSAWQCAAAQGWLFGRPVPAAEAEQLVRAPSARTPALALGWAWTPEERSAALSYLRVLTALDPDAGTHRATAATIAGGLARHLQLPGAVAEDISTLALVHDAARLARVADAPPPALVRALLEAVPGLDLLTHPQDISAASPLEVRVVAIAISIASRLRDLTGAAPHSADESAATGAGVLARLLLEAHDDTDPVVRPALAALAAQTPEIVTPAISELITALTTRASGVGSVEGRLQALAGFARVIGSVDRFLGIAELAALEARSALGAASVSIGRYEAEPGMLRILVNVGDLGPDEEPFPLDEVYALAEYPLADSMFRARAPHIDRADDVDGDAAERQLLRRLGKSSGASAPLIVDGELWGELYATTAMTSAPFTARDLDLLISAASIIAGALARAEEIARETRLAVEDPLTGLANRRAMDEAVGQALTPSRGMSRLCLVVLDVNGLKQVNDEYGHACGDRVLRGVATALRTAAQAEDGASGALAGRIGGDEFCLLLPGLDAPGAAQVVAHADRLLRDGPPPTVSLSAGIAETAPGSAEPAELYRRADAAQYQAKRQGTLCVVAGLSGTAAAPSVEREAPEAVRHRRAQESRLLINAAAAVDGLAPGASMPERLQFVGEVCGQVLELSRWAVSCIAPDGMLRVTRIGLHRVRPQPTLASLEHEIYPLADYPLSETAIRTGSTFLVQVDDPLADPSERAMLAELGMRGMLAAGSPEEGGWLLELFADEMSADLELAHPLLRMLLRLVGLNPQGSG